MYIELSGISYFFSSLVLIGVVEICVLPTTVIVIVRSQRDERFSPIIFYFIYKKITRHLTFLSENSKADVDWGDIYLYPIPNSIRRTILEKSRTPAKRYQKPQPNKIRALWKPIDEHLLFPAPSRADQRNLVTNY